MEKLRRDIRFAFNLAKERRANVASKEEKVELETRLGVSKNEDGTKYLLWSNGYKAVSDVAKVKTYTEPYSQEVFKDGYNSYRRRGNKWEIKTTSAKYDNPDIYSRVQVSIEAPSHPPSDLRSQSNLPAPETITRNISRHSFTMNKSARVDFSMVYTIEGKHKPKKLSFEVEVEYTHATELVYNANTRKGIKPTPKVIVISSLEEYTSTVEMVHRMMFQTPLVFTRSQLREASGIANAMLSATPAYANMKVDEMIPYVNRAYFSEARALDLNSLTMARLFGANGTGVIASPKTDGEREFLVITEHGSFGVYPPSRAALYSTSDYTKSSKVTIIDCEKYEGVLYHIDTLFIEGEDFRNRTFMARKAEFEDWVNRVTPEDIGVVLKSKPTVPLTRKDFFNQLEILYQSWKSLEYKIDGIMLTPETLSYIDTTGITPVIMKWKSEITIDLCVNHGKLWCSDTATKEQVEFRGTVKVPLDKVIMGDINAVQGSIVEFKCQGKNLVALKLRPEKIGPNTSITAHDNWEKATIDVVTEDTLLCKTNEIMRKFHGRIKWSLFTRGTGILLDIGSGRGGDLAKWGSYDLVLCVEPSKENMDELKSRLANMEPHVQSKVKTLQAYGQEYKKIHRFVMEHLAPLGKTKVDVVAMMDSLTFFFMDDGKALADLKKTIDLCLKDTGLFIWKAMDGTKAKQAVSYSSDPVRFGNDYIQDRDGLLYVNISPNVEGFEGYTNISELMNKLEMKGTVQHCLATNELMSDDYSALSSMYAYGVFTFNRAIVVPEGVTSVLLRGKPHIEYLNVARDKYYPSCIEAIEAMFTSTPHSELISAYIEEALKTDPDYQTSGKDPSYTKFETTNLGYLVKLFYSNVRTETEIIASLDATDDQASLAFAGLLGIDVQIGTESSVITNKVKGVERPSLYVRKEKYGYMVDTGELEEAMEPDVNDPIFDLHDLLYDMPPIDLRMYIKLSTPVLIRTAYVDGIDTETKLTCISNEIFGKQGRVIPDNILEEYDIKDIDLKDAVSVIRDKIAEMDKNR